MAYDEFTFLDDDEDFPWHPADDGKGVKFSRFGLINAQNPLAALRHVTVPRVGDRYDDAQYIFVKSKRVVERTGGRPFSSDGATYKIEVVYETPTWSGAGILRPITPNDAWTEVTFGNTSLTVYRDVGVEYPPSTRVPPINGGDGVGRDVGTIEAAVKVWYDQAGFVAVDHTRLVTLSQGVVNAAAVSLPSLMGSGLRLNFGPGMVRYRNTAYEREGEFYGIVHNLVLAPDHLHREFTRDEHGELGNEFTTRVLYESADMSGLWP
jgi:hypothetical protein